MTKPPSPNSTPTPVTLSEATNGSAVERPAFVPPPNSPSSKTALLNEGEGSSQPTDLSQPLVPGPWSLVPDPAHHRTFAMRWLTNLLFIPLMAASTIFFGCISLICGLWDRSGRQQHAIASLWGRSLLEITLSPVTLIGEENLSQHPVAVYASNHLSYMDTPALFGMLPFQFRIFAKSSLWKIPFIGWYLNRSGQVPIDQQSSRTAIAGLLRGVATIKSGLSLVLFPEGGRAEGGNLQTMMSGCAFMAIRAGVPLIPIALVGTYELLPIHTYHLSPRPLKLIVGQPISTEGLTTRDADTLTARLFDAISALYFEHSQPS